MDYYSISYNGCLQHHGIKGQKWGVRRFQNPDGTWTAEGKARYGDLSPEDVDAARKEKLQKNLKTAAKIAVATAAVAGISYYAYKNPEKAKQMLISGRDKTLSVLKKAGKDTVNAVEKSLKASATAATNGAMTAAGAVAITKIDELIPDNSKANKIIKQTAKESIRATTNSLKTSTSSTINSVGKVGGNSLSNKGGDSGKRASSDIGAPSGKAVDRSSMEYRELFSGVSDETKSVLKAMASQGYDIDQLQKYKELHHSAIYGKNYRVILA